MRRLVSHCTREIERSMDPCLVVDLGRRSYLSSWELQRKLVTLRKQDLVSDVLLLVEHPPTYTIGRNGDADNLLVPEAELTAAGIPLVRTDRGGDITFHGPGQLVGYPILNLKLWKADVHAYLRRIEEVMIRAVADFGVVADRRPDKTGIWHPDGKLGAIGVRLSRWVSSHGFALNVSTDLSYFKRIVPCGIVGHGVSSMESVLCDSVPINAVREAIVSHFGECFSRTMELATEARLAG